MHYFISRFFCLPVFTLLNFFIILLINICDLNLLAFLLDKLLLLSFCIMNKLLIVHIFFKFFIRHSVAISLLVLIKHVVLCHIELNSALCPQLLPLLFPLFNTLFDLIWQFFKRDTFFRDVLCLLLLLLFFILFVLFGITFLLLFRLLFYIFFWCSHCWLVKLDQLRNFGFLFQIFNNFLILGGHYHFIFWRVFGCDGGRIKTQEEVVLRSFFINDGLGYTHTSFSFPAGSNNWFPAGRLDIDDFLAYFRRDSLVNTGNSPSSLINRSSIFILNFDNLETPFLPSLAFFLLWIHLKFVLALLILRNLSLNKMVWL